MRKETLLEIIIGTVGGLIFAVGMCMCLLPEWNMLYQGVVVGTTGFIVLLCIIPVYKKSHPKKASGPVNLRLVITFAIGIAGALVMGYGMSRIMVESAGKSDMIVGMITGIIGLIVCVLNYPVYAFSKNND